MAHEHDDDFYKLTFSQREGEVPLPEPMRLEHVPQRFRQLVWQVIDGEIRESSYDYYGPNYHYDDYRRVSFSIEQHLGSIVRSYKFDVLDTLHDEIEEYGPIESANFFKELITGGNYHKVLTLIEFVLRHQYCSKNLRKALIAVFDNAPVAYFVKKVTGCFTIMPRMSKESGEATQQAIQAIQNADMRGASTHLRQAAEHINAQQFADSIVDSIHAVESVARMIDPKAKRTLGPALDSLERAKLLHPAIKEAFSKLYGYTSDEQGIRHALLNKDSPDVDLDEAMFMFGACASFAAYLVNKQHKMQSQENSSQ